MQKWAGAIILMVALGWLALADANAAWMSSTQATQASTGARESVVAPTANVVYVNASVSGGAADGSSWPDAYPTLQDALSDTASVDEIWVAKGVYYPDEGGLQTNNSVTATFQLTNSVAIYGGFVGTETAHTQRDWQNNITVLSGDIDGNDTNKDSNGIIPATSDIVGNNAYHVVTGSGTDSSALLDGFTINAGQANGTTPNNRGGGIYNDSGSPALTNVTISANSATRDGGGIYDISSNSKLTNLTISANSALAGGGIYNIFFK